MIKNTASQKVTLFAFDSTTGLAKTGDAANITAYVSKDYGSVTVLGDTSATEMDSTNAKGWYLFDVTQSETDADYLLFTGKSSTANIVVVSKEFCTSPPYFTTQSIDSNGRVDVIKVAGTTQTARDIGASVLLSAGTGTGQLDFTSGVVKSNVTQFGGTNATTSSGRPEVNTTHLGGSTTPVTEIGNGYSYTAGSVAAHNIVDQGTAQAVTSTTIQLRSAAAFADSELVGCTVAIRSATTGAGQSRVITAYTGSTDTATVDAWTTTPSGTVTYQVFGTAQTASGLPAPVNVKQWNGTTVATPATAGVPDVNIKNVNNVSASSVTTVSAYQGTTQPVNFTGTGASAFAKSDMVSVLGSAVSTSSAQIGVNVVNAGGTAWGSGAITAAAIADGAIDRATFAVDTGLQNIRSNTAQGGASTTITLDASASATTDFYKNDIVYIVSGTGAGQSRFITAYNGTTKVATVATWATNPDNTSVFAILPFDAVSGGGSAPTAAQVATAVWQDTTAGDFTVSGSIGKSLFTSGVVPGGSGGLLISGTNSGTTTLGALTVSGATTLAAVTASGTVTMNAFTVTNATTLSGSVTATHASNDIRGVRLSATGVDDIWDEVLAAHTTADTSGLVLNMLTQDSVTLSSDVALGSIIGQMLDNGTSWTYDRSTDSQEALRDAMGTAAAVADAVWDEGRSSHIATGTFGQALQLLRDGTAQGGDTSTITLDNAASVVDDFYKNGVVQIIDGTGAGETNLIESYVGTTHVATVRTAWATSPDSTSVFVVHPSGLDLDNLDTTVSSRMPAAGGSVTVTSGDDLEFVIGVDYTDANDAAVEFGTYPTTWPDLTNAAVTLILQNPVSTTPTEIAGVVDVAAGTSQSIHFDVPYTTTNSMISATGLRYWVKAVLTSGHVCALVQGALRWRTALEE